MPKTKEPQSCQKCKLARNYNSKWEVCKEKACPVKKFLPKPPPKRKDLPQPSTLRPVFVGEFESLEDWLARAGKALKPQTSDNIPLVCIDALGRRCSLYKHFVRARDEGTFPVRFFYECEGGRGSQRRKKMRVGNKQGSIANERLETK